DHVIDDEGGGSVGCGGGVGAVGEVEDDPVPVCVVRRGVKLADDDVIGDDVVEPGVVVEPLVGVVGDAAGPAIPLGSRGGRGHVTVVVDKVVVGGEVIAVADGDAGAAGIGHGIVDEAEVMNALTRKGVAGITIAIDV